jgi:hypothetical protein
MTMTRHIPWSGRLALLLFLPTGILPFVYSSAQHSAFNRALPNEPRSPSPIAAAARTPNITDWTNRHSLYSLSGKSSDIEAVRSRDPRATMRWREREEATTFQRIQRNAAVFLNHRFPRRFPNRTAPPSLDRDWAIYLGTGGTAPSMFPAKYTFNVTTAASCANDFVVFPINSAASATQPNIAAFNNLYSGTGAGGTGICNRAGGATLLDSKTAATVLWSYIVKGIGTGAAVPTSPSLSFDGTKVAFVESGSGAAHFHVLAGKSGDGQGAAINKQSVASPATATIVTTAPTANSGTVTDLNFGSTTDTLSSPYIDYSNDTAYVGNDAGVLYRFKNVFCTLPACGTAAPSLDATWGTSGAVTVCSGKLTAPVLDFINMTLYVGCSDGKLYSITQSGTVASLVIGDGASKTYGGIVDPPVVDSLNEFVYAVSGSANGGANAVMVQTTTTFSSSVAVPIGSGNLCNMHSPTPNNAYFTSPTSAGALMYEGGLQTTGTVGQPCSAALTGTNQVVLYASTFNSSGVLNSGTPAHGTAYGTGPGYEWAPLTEFFNSTTGVDWVFISALQSNQANVGSTNVTSGFPTATPTFIQEGFGASGIVVDNNSASAQAASIYFSAQQQNTTCNNVKTLTFTGGCATKLTQNGLN